jgi:hypothetical protein
MAHSGTRRSPARIVGTEAGRDIYGDSENGSNSRHYAPATAVAKSSTLSADANYTNRRELELRRERKRKRDLADLDLSYGPDPSSV